MIQFLALLKKEEKIANKGIVYNWLKTVSSAELKLHFMAFNVTVINKYSLEGNPSIFSKLIFLI